jgi:proteasome-associated ATPase
LTRPNEDGAKEIFAKYLTADLPLYWDDLIEFDATDKNPQPAIDGFIGQTVERMYEQKDHNKFLEVTYANGDKEILYFADFNSGAMIQNVVDRAKDYAIEAELEHKERGIRLQHLLDAVKNEFLELVDMPNTTSPDDWAKISGKKGERIVYIRTVVEGADDKGRAIDTATNTGQYL